MAAYTLTAAEYRDACNRLKRALATKDDTKILNEAARAEALFEEKGYPDNWMDWQRAKDDIEMRRAHSRKW